MEEKEEEEGSVGLEDFGFALQAKKGDEEDVDAEADDKNFYYVVNEMSDGEVEEEEGENNGGCYWHGGQRRCGKENLMSTIT